MKQRFSTKWIRSKQKRKQRKYRRNAPLHIVSKFMHVHLSKDLRKKYGRRAIRARKGDTVKILRGQFKKKSGKVVDVNLSRRKVYVENIRQIRKEGTKSPYPLEPSNLMLISLNLDDKIRKEKLEKKKNAS
ncbi:50S ribosomal protein L24 [Candidatus Woesearchaeota archaeon]|nr:50S ribosomal protein L24 [Candidatus Woesearchaeota archaeon]